MKWTIEIYYKTGNSFGSHEKTETIDLEWEDLDFAKEGLKRIKEHYFWLVDESIQPNWHKEKFGNSNYSNEDLIVLLTDKNKEFQMSCFWIGYFEKLISAEIVPVNNGDMKFEP